jgi:hypothetical protein
MLLVIPETVYEIPRKRKPRGRDSVATCDIRATAGLAGPRGNGQAAGGGGAGRRRRSASHADTA